MSALSRTTASMSTGGKRPSRVVLQDALFGGVDVVELFCGNKRNVLHCPSSAGASRQASALAERDGAELVHLADVPVTSTCPQCGTTGDTQAVFGIRELRGRLLPQSWCRSCRRG